MSIQERKERKNKYFDLVLCSLSSFKDLQEFHIIIVLYKLYTNARSTEIELFKLAKIEQVIVMLLNGGFIVAQKGERYTVTEAGQVYLIEALNKLETDIQAFIAAL